MRGDRMYETIKIVVEIAFFVCVVIAIVTTVKKKKK